jgi:hypothetical protein
MAILKNAINALDPAPDQKKELTLRGNEETGSICCK